MSARHVLVIDAGTSAVRCLIVDNTGHLKAVCCRGWRYQSLLEAGLLGKEFIPGDFWQLIGEVIREALHNARINANDIAGVSSTSQREGMVLLDSEGRELYAGPNIDLRAVTEGILIDSKYAREVHSITGHLPSLLFAPAKLKWFGNNQPEIFRRIATVLTINDWIIYRLCGELLSEVCSVAEIGLIDVTNRTWSQKLLELLDLPRGIYPPLVSAGSQVGKVTSQAAAETGIPSGIPVIQGSPDTHCGLIGMGVVDKGTVGVVMGWSAPVQMTTDTPVFDAKGRIWTGCHVPADRWLLESSSGEAGNAFTWLTENLFSQDGAYSESIYDLIDQMALSVPPGAEGVLASIGPGVMDMSHLKMDYGGFLFPIPLSIGSIQRAHLVRAVLENICFAIKANLLQLETVSGFKADTIKIGGNLTRSQCLQRILPTIFDRKVYFSQVVEVSGLGAAICAAVGSGIYSSLDEAINYMRSELIVNEPDPLAAAEYEEHYQEWISAIRWLRELKGATQ